MKSNILALNNKPYPAYKALKQEFIFERYKFQIDYVQGDPFAAPVNVSLKFQKLNSPILLSKIGFQKNQFLYVTFLDDVLPKKYQN